MIKSIMPKWLLYHICTHYAVLILLHRGVEQTGAIGQAEPPHSLLDEVEMLVGEAVLRLQARHAVRLGEHHHQVEAKVACEGGGAGQLVPVPRHRTQVGQRELLLRPGRSKRAEPATMPCSISEG